MRISHSVLYALGVSASAALAGCAGAPSPGFIPTAARSDAGQAHSWMAAQVKTASQLLYVSNGYNPAAVYVYSYPQANLVGMLTGFVAPDGECTDQAGHVWIADSLNADIVEYAHGGSAPIATLSDAGNDPMDCSVDPVTGNLAVTNQTSGVGNVAVYKRARGKPVVYSAEFLYSPYYCGYDNHGNLFVDGYSGYVRFLLAELHKGGSQLSALSVNQSIEFPGGVLWDGKHLAVLDSGVDTIYQFAIAKGAATVVGSTSLGDSSFVKQFWIADGNVIGGDAGAAYYWPYPAGGYPIKAIVGLSNVYGSVVSKRPAK